MQFDQLLQNHVGEIGKFQILLLMTMALEEILLSAQVMGPMYFALTPSKYWCKHSQLDDDNIFGNCSLDERLRMTVPAGNDVSNDGLSHCFVNDVTFPPGSCGFGNTTLFNTTNEGFSHMYNLTDNYNIKKCDNWIFDKSLFTSTLVTEWQFVCSTTKEGQANSVASVFLAGRVVGNIIFGWVADRFGRRPAYLVSGLLNTSTALVSAFVPSYLPFVILRFIQAIFGGGRSNTAFVWLMEFAGPSRRVLISTAFLAFWGLGICFLSGAAYFVRDWRHLIIVLTVPDYLSTIIAFFVCPESPRWLYVKNRAEEADKIVRKMAKINGKTLPKDLTIEQTVEQRQSSPLDLMRTPQIRGITFVLLFIWSVSGFAYYGLSFSASIFGDNIFLTTVISGLMEIPANALLVFLFMYGKRIPTYATCMFLCAFCMFTSMALSNNESLSWLYLTLAIIGRSGIAVVFNMAWIYTGECFPTCIRSTGISWTSVGARICSPLGPFLLMLAAYYDKLPLIIIGSLTVIAGFLILLLPETHKRPMAQTIMEGEEAIKKNKLNLFCRKRKSNPTSNNNVVVQDPMDEMTSLNQNGSKSPPGHEDIGENDENKSLVVG